MCLSPDGFCVSCLTCSHEHEFEELRCFPPFPCRACSRLSQRARVDRHHHHHSSCVVVGLVSFDVVCGHLTIPGTISTHIMTLLRYSHHGSAPAAARATAGRTYVKTMGANKSWNKSSSNNHHRSWTTTTSLSSSSSATAVVSAATTTTNKHAASHYHWTRQDSSHQRTPILTKPSSIRHHHGGNTNTTWRRPMTYTTSGQSSVTEPNFDIKQDSTWQQSTNMHMDAVEPSSHPVNASTSLQQEQLHATATTTTTTATLREPIRDALPSGIEEETDVPARASSPNSSIAVEPHALAAAAARHDEESVSSTSSSSQQQLQQPGVMKKRGAHKLVRLERLDAPSQQVPIKTNENCGDVPNSQQPSENGSSALRKIAPNKLAHTNHTKPPPTAAVTDSAVADAKRKLMYSSRQRRRHHHTSSNPPPAAKRVKLTDASSESVGDSTAITGASTTEKQMTDFAYRETSKVTTHRGNTLTLHQGQPVAGPPRGGRCRRNMGLVRVSFDEAKTPICPTFMQGVACTNEACTKRHDVPKEAATPICSYFQRQGQCAKGADCPFRHIKVNPRAVVCPSFGLLGFCQNEDCLMKHVRTHHNNNNNKTWTMTTSGSRSGLAAHQKK